MDNDDNEYWDGGAPYFDPKQFSRNIEFSEIERKLFKNDFQKLTPRNPYQKREELTEVLKVVKKINNGTIKSHLYNIPEDPEFLKKVHKYSVADGFFYEYHSRKKAIKGSIIQQEVKDYFDNLEKTKEK